MLHSQAILEDFATSLGWNADSKVHLLCEFIDTQGEDRVVLFLNWLDRRAKQEKEFGESL